MIKENTPNNIIKKPQTVYSTQSQISFDFKEEKLLNNHSILQKKLKIIISKATKLIDTDISQYNTSGDYLTDGQTSRRFRLCVYRSRLYACATKNTTLRDWVVTEYVKCIVY